jgi:hypothetical protein
VKSTAGHPDTGAAFVYLELDDVARLTRLADAGDPVRRRRIGPAAGRAG